MNVPKIIVDSRFHSVINNCAIANWIEINLKHLMTHSCDDNGACEKNERDCMEKKSRICDCSRDSDGERSSCSISDASKINRFAWESEEWK